LSGFLGAVGIANFYKDFFIFIIAMPTNLSFKERDLEKFSLFRGDKYNLVVDEFALLTASFRSEKYINIC
jgi:hypothetical protein